jgi:ribonuclease HI
MNNMDLEFQSEVKYLGVTLDGRLNWKTHVQDKLKKAKMRLFQYKQVVGTTFGPTPLNMRWMYTGIIRPALCYGAVVWWRAAKAADIMIKLQRLARLALSTWGGFRKSTPTAALEIIGFIPPMDIYLEGEVTKTWHRIKSIRAEIWDGIGSGGKARGHRRVLTNISKGFPSHEYVWDEIPNYNKWSRHYDVDLDSLKCGTMTCSPIQCFTTGLRLNDRASAGLCIMSNDKIIEQEATPLGTHSTAFQAAVMAVHRAAELLVDVNLQGSVTINCDSQAVLQALCNPVAKSQVVLATMLILDTLALSSTHRVKLTWLKAQEGKIGRSTATLLARKATELVLPDPAPVIPVPSNQFKTDIDEDVTRRWNRRWQKLPTARQSRMFWPEVNKTRSMELLRQGREDFGWMVQMLTGHNYFNRHSSLVNDTDLSECRFCLEAEEDSEHLLCKCPALEAERLRLLGSTRTDAFKTSSLPLNALRRFISMLRQRADEGLDQI